MSSFGVWRLGTVRTLTYMPIKKPVAEYEALLWISSHGDDVGHSGASFNKHYTPPSLAEGIQKYCKTVPLRN
jgi:hypothetical protein